MPTRPRSRPSAIVELVGGTADRPPLVLVHGVDGTEGPFGDLAEAIGPDQPVWAVASPMVGPQAERFTAADRLALRYVADLQRDQPTGPYLLCGLGVGGVLAFEMSRHLRREGQDVALLAVVDGGPGHLGVDHDRPTLPPPWAPDRAAAVARRRHWDLTVGGWIPTALEGDLHLLWARGTPSVGPTQGWGPWLRRVDVTRLQATREQLLGPQGIPEVAQVLSGLVAGVLASTR